MSLRDTIDSVKSMLQPAPTQPHQASAGADGSELGQDRPFHHDMASRGHTAQIEGLAQRSRLQEAGLLQSGLKHDAVKNLSDTHHNVAHGHEVSAEDIAAAKEMSKPTFGSRAPQNIHVD